MESYQTLYDVSRTSPEFPAAFVAAAWMLGFAIAIIAVRNKLSGNPVYFVRVWLVLWLALAGVAFGTTSYEHSRCVRELKSGEFQVVEGPVTRFRPRRGRQSEKFTVGGVSFYDFSAKLRGSGMGATGGPVHTGAVVRIAYDARGTILRLEIRPNPGDG